MPILVPKAKQFWIHHLRWEVRVMGVIENWVVYRRKGAAPALAPIKEFKEQFCFNRI